MKKTKFAYAGSSARCRGIMLLEILVAFAILTSSLAVLLQSASASVARERAIENRLNAISHASNVLANLDTAKVVTEQFSGEIDDFYSWQVMVNPISTTASDQNNESFTLVLAAIEVEISWQEGAQRKNYQLRSKRIMKIRR